MRPETAYRKIYNAIDKYLHKGVPFDKKIILAINSLLDRTIRDLNRIEREWDFEVLSYTEKECLRHYPLSDEDLGELRYISDRFSTPHRLYWLRAMIQNKKFEENNG